MDNLLNLKEFKQQLSDKIRRSDLSDYELPDSFKNAFRSFGEYRVEEYYKYTIKISSKKSICYIPNQWVYIASICSEYCIELKKYKQKLKTLGITDDDFESCHPSSSDKSVSDEKRTNEYLSQKAAELLSSYNGEDKDLLISFLWDYDSWGGGKNIKRDNDFTVSPCLNVANSINSSSSLIGDIAKAIGDNPTLFSSIMNSVEMKKILRVNEVDKKELVRSDRAAKFLKESMKITLSRDQDFSLLNNTGKYTQTAKNLLINDYWLGRDKSQPPTRISDVFTEVEWTHDGKIYVLNVEMTPGDMENKLFPVFNDAYKNRLCMEKDTNGDYVLYETNSSLFISNSYIGGKPLQLIFYGTPGSGKSWTIKNSYEKDSTKVIRTTFHPDTDYAQFVGCYKPVPDDEDKNRITYKYVPQVFTESYVKAWSDLENSYYLIIEEINRGNCAQIFGDLFQLLDRNKEGYSEYPIKADHDLKNYLEEHLPEDSEGIKDGRLCLPPNLSIIASMNTSDQSLFPMDSAFKRRWAWEYVPIDYNNVESTEFTIKIGEEYHPWHKFLKAVNEKIKKVTSSEDKQMGNFFIKESVDEKEFCDKVMFYLWSEVGKDNYQTNDAIFKYYTDEDKLQEFSFNELYEISKRTTILKGFIRYIEEEKA